MHLKATSKIVTFQYRPQKSSISRVLIMIFIDQSHFDYTKYNLDEGTLVKSQQR